MRQPQSDLNVVAGRQWLNCYSALISMQVRAADLRAQLAVVELAEGRLAEALEEATEDIEGAFPVAAVECPEVADA